MRSIYLAMAISIAVAVGPSFVAAEAVQAAPTMPAGPVVKIDNFTFGPAVLIVKVGSTVTWINNDDVPHTVVANDHATFKSKVLDTDGTFSFTFTKPGEYPYFCSLHPHMTGKVVVRA